MLLAESARLLGEAKIVGSTLVKAQLRPMAGQQFDVAIIDESSQALVTLALLGMAKAKRWVLVGDHKQLMPILRTAGEEEAKRLSAFVYLMSKYPHRVLWLRRHYRSNSKIIGFSQRYIYGGMIEPAERCHSIKLEIEKRGEEYLDPDRPVVFIHVEGKELRSGKSRYNQAEVEAAATVVEALRRAGVKEGQIAVIAPYKAQRNKLKAVVGDGVEVGTVDAFQGREWDVVVFTVTATEDFRFVENENRLNVAFTRARKKLIVVGNAHAIERGGRLLKLFLEYARELGGFCTWKVTVATP